MVSIGALDRLITIERLIVIGSDGFGGQIVDWQELATVSASRTDVSDTERFAFGGIISTLMSRFVIRDRGAAATVSAIDRVIHEGKQWGIEGVKEAKFGRRRFLEITAKRGT